MATITITIPDTVTVGKPKLDAFVDTNLSNLTPEMAVSLLLHGHKQKVADAASAAKTQDEAIAAMQKAADAIERNEWSSRGTGEAVDEETVVARSIMRGLAKAKFGAKSPEWAAFTGLDTSEQNAKLDAMAEKNADAIADRVKEEIERRKAARKAKAALGAKVEISL